MNNCEVDHVEKLKTSSASFPDLDDVYTFEPLSKDASIWWRLTSGFLLGLISHAGFTPEQQRSSLEFYYRYIVPSLGPAPTPIDGSPRRSSKWRSFMTDDFTPVEFSWCWGNADTIPARRVRFSIEPIGVDAGTAKDPWNMMAVYSLAHRLGNAFEGVDLRWFDHLFRKLSAAGCNISEGEERSVVPLPSQSYASPTSAFLALELGDNEPLVKTYLLPPGGRQPTSCRRVIFDTLASFANELRWESLAELVSCLRIKCDCLHIQPFILAVDCIAPIQEPRMKIYLRSPDTSFVSVRNILSMFEKDQDGIIGGLNELQDLWKRLFCSEDDEFGPEKPLQSLTGEQETSGMLYYLEVRPNSPKVTAKVYLPVKHYARHDWSIAHGLTDFFKAQNRIQSEIADQYLAALKAVCGHRQLDSGRGMHTYIAARIKNGSLDITSYLNPEVYHENRYS